MFFLLFFLSSAKKPIFLVHGLGGAKTYGTLKSKVPQCPEDVDRFEVWPPNSDFAKKYPDCIAYFLETVYDEKQGVVRSNPEVQLEMKDFGDISSIPAFQTLAPFLEKKGYTRMKDLYGVTYNWIQYPTGTPTLFKELKERIENITATTGEKAIILGHSMGTHLLRRLITHEFPKEWVQKHIDGVIFSAPAFYGCFGCFDYIVQGRFSSLSYTDYVANVTRRMPPLQAMYDNYQAFKDTIVFKNTEFGDIKASGVKDFLVKKGMMDSQGEKLFSLIEDSLIEEPPQPPVRSLILYNSGLKTIVGYTGDDFTPVYGGGDTVCHSGGPKYVCEKWKNAECIDWNKNDPLYEHSPMLNREEALAKIYNFISTEVKEKEGSTWLVVGGVAAAIALLMLAVIVVVAIRKRNDSNLQNFLSNNDNFYTK